MSPFIESEKSQMMLLEHRMQVPSGSNAHTRTTIARITAAWAILLAHYAESRDVAFEVGSEDSGIGLVRASVDPTASVSHLLHSFHHTCSNIVSSGGINHLVIQSTATRHGNDSTIRNGANALHKSTKTGFDASGSLNGSSHASTNGNGTVSGHDRAAVEITLEFEHDAILARAAFDAEAFEMAQMRRVMNQFEHVLRQIPFEGGPDVRIGELELFSPQDAFEMSWWNKTPLPKVDSCIHHLIARQVDAHPDASAVSAWDLHHDLTYGMLDDLSNRLAHHLKGLGVGPDVFVPFCFEKSAWAVVSMLGIIKAGGACVGLDGNHPLARLKSIVRDCDAKVILTSNAHLGLVSHLQITALVVDEAFLRNLPSNSHPACTSVTTKHAAYVTFTSGTTGQPKGIVIEHQAICASGLSQGSALRLGPTSRVLQFSAYSFDISNGDILNTLMNGGCVCVPSENDRSNDLAGFINRTGVNWACLTPSVASILRPSTVPTLETLVLCGEPIKQETVTTWAESVYLVDAYGPAETTILCTSLPGVKIDTPSANLGWNMGAVTWIANPSNHAQLQPLGCVGEILIEGPLLSRGYLNDPEKTSHSFITDPPWARSSGGESRRFYKSGDLGLLNTDGTTTFVRRKDTQVKIRGQRVELHEVEHHLHNALPPTVGPVVADVISVEKRELLMAFICLSELVGRQVDFESVTHRMKATLALAMEGVPVKLAASLPGYMIPSAIVPLQEIPLTRSGKVDRATLRELVSDMGLQDFAAVASDMDRKEPSTELEKQLQHHWAQVLNLDRRTISAHDNFMKLGGDSLAAMKLVAACRASNINLQVATVFRAPTLADMAASVVPEDLTQDEEIPPFSLLHEAPSVSSLVDGILEQCVDIKSADMIIDAYPCTAIQEGLMALSHKQIGSYIAQDHTELPDDIDMSRFLAAWERTVEACDILRTRLVNSDEGTLQVVLKAMEPWFHGQVADMVSVEEFLLNERNVFMQFGQPLSRWAVVVDTSTGIRHFVWTIHHAIYDGWSMPLIKNMVEFAYTGQAIEKPTKFNKFIQQIVHTRGEANDDFWKSYFEECEAPTFPSVSPTTYQPHARSILDHSFNITRLQESSYTLPTVLRAAFAQLVGCYVDSNDVVFGATLAGRNAPIPGIDTLIGPTISTLPIRISWDDSSTIDDFLDGVQDQSVAMIPFEHSGLQNIQKVSEAARFACQFQSLLIIQPLPEVKSSHIFSAGKIMGGELADYGSYAFILQCMLEGDEVVAKATFDENVVDHMQARRYLNQFEHLVRQLCTLDGSTTLGDISAVTATDTAEILNWNSRPLEYIDSSFQEYFKIQVKQRPHAVAVYGHDGTLTYKELDEVSTHVARHLVVEEGVKPDAFVPLCFEKSLWAVVAIIATVKAGACIVTMDPSHPVSRLHTIVSAVQAKIVLCSSQYASYFRGQCDQVLVVNETTARPHDSGIPLPVSSAQTALYTIFTSGSTGTPKGVVTEHGAFLSSAIAYGKGFLMTSESRVLQYSSFSFDVCVLETFTPLIFGACICVVSEDDRLNDLGAAMARLEVSWGLLTPTVARTVDPEAVPTLEVLLIGAEPVGRQDIAQWEPHVSHLFESYGPSECSVISSAFAGPNSTTDPRNIGRAFNANYWITAAGDPNILVPIGSVGELLIEGPILAREYLGDPIKTKTSFVTNLAWAKEEQIQSSGHPRNSGTAPRRFYRTGDLAHYDSDGNVIYDGRRDTQVKLRGQRIEMGEIEHHILRLVPDIQSAVVEVVRNGPDNSQATLMAFICLLEHGEIARPHDYLAPESSARDAFVSILRSVETSLSTLLPKYMVPSLFLPLWRLPMTSSKKVDRRKLSELAQGLSDEMLVAYKGQAVVGRKPSTIAEERLQHAWAKILSIEPTLISAEDNFLDIGGDSVQAIRLVATCRAEGWSLSVPQIFQNPILADMALCLVESDGTLAPVAPFALLDESIDETRSTAAMQCNISIEDIEDIYPCTALQEGLIISSTRTPGSYVARHVIELPPDTVLDRFKAAVEMVVDSAPILRTRIFQSCRPNLLQVVLRRREIAWSIEPDLEAALADSDQFCMGIGEPLAKYGLVKDITAQKVYFLWITHHVLYDGWSVTLLKGHIDQAYRSLSSQTPQSCPQAPYNRLVKYTSEAHDHGAKDFWHEYLKGAVQPAFPVVPPGKQPHPDQLFRSKIVLDQQRSSNHFTTSTIIRAAWALLVQSYSGSTDVVFGTTLSGRDTPLQGIEQVLGPSIATVPVRISVDAKSLSVESFLQNVQEQMAEMIPHQHMGIQNIQKLSDDAYDACLFQNLISVQPAEEQDTGICSSWSNPEDDLHRFNPHALMVRCDLEEPVDSKTTVSIVASYDSSILDATQMRRTIQQLEYVANGILASSLTDTVGSIELISPQDKRELKTWNTQDKLKPVEACLHELFQNRAHLAPKTAAVSSWDGELSYEELDRLSSHLSALLITHGVQRGSSVALCFEKTKWMVVAVVATLKAGAIVVALDHKHPVSRLEQILSSVEAKLLLTSTKCSALLGNKVETSLLVDQLDLDQVHLLEPAEPARPEDVAVVVFTSGSTGTPKGYIIQHRAMASSASEFGKAYSLSPQSRVFQFGSYAHDVMILEIIVPLIFGACICIPTEEERLSMTAEAMRRMAVNWAFFTPSVARLIQPLEVPGLRVLVLGGEALSEGDIHQWSGHVDHLINGYGPGECSIFSSAKIDVTPGTDARDIGKTFNAHYWIVDAEDANRLCPIGGIGELLIEGPILAKGYLNEPEKTAKAFIGAPRWELDLPFTSSSRILYRTGDLARYSADGSVIFLGRIDSQVKIRGQRTELAEVEHQLRRAMPSVTAAVAEMVELKQEGSRKALIAFLCFGGESGEEGSAMIPEDLNDPALSEMVTVEERLSECLPIYMIPSHFIPFQSFPLTRSGKTDRRKLQQFASKLSMKELSAYALLTSGGQEKLEPCTTSEILLQNHWAATLNLEASTIGRDDHFFKLGGDSIAAIHLVTSLRNSGYSLLTSELFRSPHLRNMAQKLNVLEAGSELDPEPFTISGGLICTDEVSGDVLSQSGLEGHVIEDIYPTTPLQEGLMALSIKQPGSYIAQFSIALGANGIDTTRFRHAWERLVDVVPILRTRICNSKNSESLQVVTKEPIEWLLSDDLESYLEKDRNSNMSFGGPLTHYAIVSSDEGDHFVWTLHHALYDAWSIRLILEHVHRNYTGASISRPANFSRYIKYIVEVEEAVGAESEEFWRSQLLDATPSEFPATPSSLYQPKPDSQMDREFSLPGARPDICTLSTLAWAAWALVVSRYTGSTDVLFGTVLSGRYAPVPDIERIVGPTLNTVPIRHKIDPFQSIDEYLENFQDQATELIPFETFGLQRIQRLSDSAYEACSFNSMLVVQSKQDNPQNDDGFYKHMSTHGEVDFASYPLALECTMAESQVKVTATYDSEIVDSQQMHRIVAQFRHALAQLCLGGQSTISTLDILSTHDIDEILEWNSRDFPAVRRYLDGMFKESASRHPQATAVDACDGQFTYSELDETSTALAAQLIQLGVGREVAVPLAFNKSKWVVVAMLATSKAGGVFVPMDPSQPLARAQSILSQTQARTILCSPQYSDLFRPLCKNVLVVGDGYMEQVTPAHIDTLATKTLDRDPQDAAYIIFTSGSTGEPKGCVITHEAYCSSVTAYARDLVSSTTRALQFASYSFDACILEIFTPLISGGCVCIPSDEMRLNNIVGAISEMAVNWAALTPSTAKLVNPDDIPTLKTLLIGGEALSKDDIPRWKGRADLFHMYGPTECAVVASRFARITEGTHPNNIGTSYASNFWIVDSRDHDVLLPIGAVGELLIDGPVLARGYLGDPGKTAASFIESPRWLPKGQPPRRMYKTGDLVRYNSDGTINFVGRNDTQIKLRGLRIQLDEVEHHLHKALPEIPDLVAELVHVEGKASLVAFLSLGAQHRENSPEQDLFSVDAAAKSRLSSLILKAEDSLVTRMHIHMIPSAYIPVQSIPSTVAGKTDRGRLRRFVSGLSISQLDAIKVHAAEEHVDPSTPTEQKLQAIWATILDREAQTISARDSFFKLGGDSILAIRLVGACRAEGILLSATNVFRNPRLCDMSLSAAVSTDELQDAEIPAFSLIEGPPGVVESVCQHAATQCRISREDIEDIYPCTALQEGLMALSIRLPGTYIAQGIVELPSDTDIERLKAAWEKTVELNPILRTRIIQAAEGDPVRGPAFLQAVVRESISWSIGDSLDKYKTLDRDHRMGLGAPLSRYAIIHDSVSGCQYFVWTVHHALYDGWSMSLILRSVDDAYRYGSPKTPASFKSYISYLAEKHHDHASEAYWQSSLHDAVPASFPPSIPTNKELLPDSTLRHIIQVPSGFHENGNGNATLANIIRAAWALLISRYTDSHDVVFGAVVTGRTASVPGIGDIAGPTVNTVPIRAVIDPQKSVADYLRQVQDHATALIPYETYGLQRIQRLGPGAHAACQFHNLLVMQPDREDNSKLICPVQATAAGDLFDNLSGYSLGVQCSLRKQTVEIYAGFDSSVVSHKQMQRIISQFDHLTQQLSQPDNAALRLGELDVLSPEDRQEITAWYASQLERPQLCLDEMFEASVRQNRERIAIEAWDGVFTYDQLNQAAGHLAQHLVDAGVGPEVKVPLCFQKSKWMVVAMLAVVKAGGAMVPMDPAHPQSRLEFIVDAVGAKTVLCSPDQAGWITKFGKTAIVVESSVDELPSPKHAPSGRTRLNSSLYVIFTSGSSGEPKGCIVEHKAFGSIVPHLTKGVLFGPSTRILQLASYSFGAANAEILSTLLHGGCLCIVPNEARANLPQVVKQMNVNYLFMSPTFSRLIPPQAIPTVKTLLMGAESMSASDLEKWTPHVRVVQGYGQTECSTLGLSYPDMAVGVNPRNVGRPAACRVWIVDASDPNMLAPLGAVGELLVEGPILARGYLNDPQKTAAAFIEPPTWRDTFSSLGSCDRLYRTGDLACFHDDGTVLMMGRKDNQVNLRGQRIELGEIEHHVRKFLTSARGVVVELAEIVKADGGTHSALVAFVALDLGPGTDHTVDFRTLEPAAVDALASLVSGLSAHLSQTLPPYMMPSAYLPLPAIPTNSSGKVDRRKMREMTAHLSMEHLVTYSFAKMTRRAPSTDMEKLLERLWLSVLPPDIGPIGVDDHFLQIGGDSLTAIQLVTACRAEGLTLAVADIFKNPTLSKMAQAVRSAQVETSPHRPFSSPQVPADEVITEMIDRGFIQTSEEVEDILEATYIQSSFVACGLMKQKSKTNYFSLDFSVPVDAARFMAACEMLVARHQILRTIFVPYRQQLLQVVLRSYPGDFTQYQCGSDIQSFAAKVIDEDNADIAAFGKSFVRFMLFDGGVNGFRLTIRINHAQFDGMSLPLVIKDLAALYDGQAALSEWPGFPAFVHSSREMHDAGAIEFYSHLLAGSSMTEVSTQNTQPYHNYPASKVMQRQVPHVAFPEYGITFPVVLKTAWAMVLAAVTGQPDVVFGYLVSGRNLPMPQIEEVVGPCINITPVRLQAQPRRVQELLEDVRDQSLEAMPYENFSLEKIVAECTPWPRSTRFGTIVQCQHVAIEPGAMSFGENECFLTATNQPSDLTDLLVDAMPLRPGAKDAMLIQFLYSDQRVPSSEVAHMADLLCSYMDRMQHDLDAATQPAPEQKVLRSPLNITTPDTTSHEKDIAPEQMGHADRKHTSLHSIVAKVWNKVFGSEVNPNTPFYDLWGSPIAAAELASRYQMEGLCVEMEDIIEHPSMSSQMELLRGHEPRLGS